MTHVCEDIRLLNVKTLWKTHSESVFWTSDALKLQPEYAWVFNISPAPCSCWNHRRIYCLSYFFYTKAVAVEYISLGFLGWKKVLLSLCLTSCVVARRHWFIALIGRLVRQSLCVCVIGRFVGFLVLDENFAYQLLRTGQRDTWLQLQIHTIEEKTKTEKREINLNCSLITK